MVSLASSTPSTAPLNLAIYSFLITSAVNGSSPSGKILIFSLKPRAVISGLL